MNKKESKIKKTHRGSKIPLKKLKTKTKEKKKKTRKNRKNQLLLKNNFCFIAVRVYCRHNKKIRIDDLIITVY